MDFYIIFYDQSVESSLSKQSHVLERKENEEKNLEETD